MMVIIILMDYDENITRITRRRISKMFIYYWFSFNIQAVTLSIITNRHNFHHNFKLPVIILRFLPPAVLSVVH